MDTCQRNGASALECISGSAAVSIAEASNAPNGVSGSSICTCSCHCWSIHLLQIIHTLYAVEDMKPLHMVMRWRGTGQQGCYCANLHLLHRPVESIVCSGPRKAQKMIYPLILPEDQQFHASYPPLDMSCEVYVHLMACSLWCTEVQRLLQARRPIEILR